MTFELPKLQFPEYEFKIIQKNEDLQIFDEVRKQYVTLTPEEWVRQHMIKFCDKSLGYPVSFMAVEKGLKVNGLQKRIDILVYNSNRKPWMIIECKAPSEKNQTSAIFQAAYYNYELNTEYLTITNGIKHYCYKLQGEKFEPLKGFPSFPSN